MNMKIRLLARTVTYDKDNEKILLVRNKGVDYWYVPGGGWEYEKENILECAKREVYEETGLHVEVMKMLYVQEFHKSEEAMFLETFWLARLSHEQILNEEHSDLDPDGMVEEARWFTKEELQGLTIFPKLLKDSFWENIESILTSGDPFIGVNFEERDR